jgi:hypothetical protein
MAVRQCAGRTGGSLSERMAMTTRNRRSGIRLRRCRNDGPLSGGALEEPVVTDESLEALLWRACETFGDDTIERALHVAAAVAGRSHARDTALRAAFAGELRRILTAH